VGRDRAGRTGCRLALTSSASRSAGSRGRGSRRSTRRRRCDDRRLGPRAPNGDRRLCREIVRSDRAKLLRKRLGGLEGSVRSRQSIVRRRGKERPMACRCDRRKRLQERREIPRTTTRHSWRGQTTTQRLRRQLWPDLGLRLSGVATDENPDEGLSAKNPSATYQVEGHVLNGSKRDFKSQFISTSWSEATARDKYGGRVVRIDLSMVTGNVYNLADKECRESLLRGSTSRNMANADQEVLIEGFVPASAIEEIP
jgi:hypothetical protein